MKIMPRKCWTIITVSLEMSPFWMFPTLIVLMAYWIVYPHVIQNPKINARQTISRTAHFQPSPLPPRLPLWSQVGWVTSLLTSEMAVTELCPRGSFEYGSHCYFFNPAILNAFEAELSCLEVGGTLTSIHDAFTNGFLQCRHLRIRDQTNQESLSDEGHDKFRQSSDFWIGLNQLGTDNTWGWVDGSPLDFSDWKHGRPQSGGGCVAVSLSDGYWNVQDCYTTKPFVCLVPGYSSWNRLSFIPHEIC